MKRKTILETCNEILGRRGGKARFGKLENFIHGTVDLETRRVTINKRFRKNRTVCLAVTFHELGHLMCLDEGIWPAYHSATSSKKAYNLTAWKAELWVDKWAAKQLSKEFPNIKYVGGYDESDRVWFKALVFLK